LVRISGIKRRISAAVVLVALAAPFAGTAPLAANSAGTMAGVEAVCPAATPGTAQCLALRRTDITAPHGSAVTPSATTGYLAPADIQSAYGLPTGSQGSGLTVAIVDAYDLPTAEADLASYRSYWGLPPCTTANGCFRKVNQSGNAGPYPAADAGWGYEIALDIDMVSAACPHCSILLVEANNNDDSNLGPAVNTAVSMGAIAVSNSYGGPEWSGESSYDALYYNHPGVAITASTGDCGYNCSGVYGGTTNSNVEYPAASPYVIAVGGTSLTSDNSVRGWHESAWGDADGGAGSGCSLYEPKPSWQHDTGCANRTQADVSAVADPETGVYIFENGDWYVTGGTSAASPIIAATFALRGDPAAGTYPASYLYGATGSLNDVVGGNNDVTWGNCTVTYLCNGVSGYDGPTGLGTPNGIGAFTAPTVPGKPRELVAVAGNTTADLTWTAPSSDGNRAITGYTVTETEHGLGHVTCFMTGATSCTISGLANATEYTFTAHATNSLGPGPESDPSNKVTPHSPTLPGKPTSVSATASAGAALVSWTAPVDNGASTITSYAVTSSPDGKICTTSGSLNCSVSGLTNGTGYTFTVIATNGVGPGPASDPSSSVTPLAGATYHAITPARVLDTRNGRGGLSGPLTNHAARTFVVTGGSTGVPPSAIAVTGNLTVTGQTSSGYLSLGPIAANDPGSSTLNFPVADDRANAVTVALGVGGTLSITFVAPSTGPTANAIFDVTGYFTPDTTGATYYAMSPTRALDTRSGIGLSGPFTNHAARTFAVAGVPAGAIAVTGNLTVTGQTSSGYLFIGPFATNNPGSSSLNFPLGDDRANAVTVALGAGGTLSITFVAPSNGPNAQAIFDVTGYFTGGVSGATYVPLTPARILDTRNGTGGLSGPFTNHAARTFGVSGVPSTAVAVTGNLTVTGQTSSGYLYVGPVAMSNPTGSTLNFPVGDDRANAVTVALSGGSLSITFVAPSNGPTAQGILTSRAISCGSGRVRHDQVIARALGKRPTVGSPSCAGRGLPPAASEATIQGAMGPALQVISLCKQLHVR
jgi:hypothetical protein